MPEAPVPVTADELAAELERIAEMERAGDHLPEALRGLTGKCER